MIEILSTLYSNRTVVITAITAITSMFYSTVVITKGSVIRIILLIEL